MLTDMDRVEHPSLDHTGGFTGEPSPASYVLRLHWPGQSDEL
jgi:hypothetical protein